MIRDKAGEGSPIGTSLWRSVNPAPPPANPLEERLSADVLIIGAGVAGLSLGWHLGEQRVDTVILESEDEATAATGASAGIIAPQLVRRTPNAVLKGLGAELGGRLLRMIAASGNYTFELIGRLRIDCDARQSGFINPSSGRDAARIQSKIVEEWRPFRSDLRVTGAADVRTLTGCRGYRSAIVDASGGCLDPIAFSRGLAKSAKLAGVRLHHRSRVVALERGADGWIARTSAGQVTARRVVLCANGGNSALHPSLAQTILPLPVCEVATQPLAPSVSRNILPLRHALTDSSGDIFSIRFDAANRLITATAGRQTLDYQRINHLINERLVASIPDYRRAPLEYIWQGTAWLNGNLLPRVLQVDENLWAVQACNGRGLALNTIIGRELGEWLGKSSGVEPRFPLETPKPVAGFAFTKYLPGLMLGGAALAKRVMCRVGIKT